MSPEIAAIIRKWTADAYDEDGRPHPQIVNGDIRVLLAEIGRLQAVNAELRRELEQLAERTAARASWS